MKNYIPVLVVGKLSWKSSGIFNPNAFPSELRSTAMNCGDQLALIKNSLVNTKTLIEKQKIDFLEILKKDPSFKGFTPDPKKPAIAFYHNLAFLTYFISFFVYFKAFLDQYTRLVSRLISSRSSIFGFNKQNIDGHKISGGRLINWLRNSTPSDFEDSSILADILFRHVSEWIDEIIQIRDFLIHNPNFLAEFNISIPLNSSVDKLSSEDVSPPKIPRTNFEILLYMEEALKHLSDFIHETLPLLPNVDFSLLPDMNFDNVGGNN